MKDQGSGGYETANEAVDPTSFAFLNDMADSMNNVIRKRVGKSGWNAKRFNRFPRFNIYLQKDQDGNHFEKNFISLNNKMINFLMKRDPSKEEQTGITTEQAAALINVGEVSQRGNIGPISAVNTLGDED